MFTVIFSSYSSVYFSRTAKTFHDRALLHFARLTPVSLVAVTSSRHHGWECRGPLRHSYHQSQLHHGNHQHHHRLLPRQPKVTEPKLFLFYSSIKYLISLLMQESIYCLQLNKKRHLSFKTSISMPVWCKIIKRQTKRPVYHSLTQVIYAAIICYFVSLWFLVSAF